MLGFWPVASAPLAEDRAATYVLAPLGDLAFAGVAPDVFSGVAVAAGPAALLFAAPAPGVSTGFPVLVPAAGALLFDGYAPAVRIGASILLPAPGNTVLNAFAPQAVGPVWAPLVPVSPDIWTPLVPVSPDIWTPSTPAATTIWVEILP
jgi:hypothetical protein